MTMMLDQAAIDLLPSFVEADEGEARAITLAPVGPIASAFRDDRRFVTAIMGPYGSAKTTTCFQKIINATLWQRPGRDGVRRSRGMVVRSTYGQLETNVMADWFGWFPKTQDNWNGKEHKHTLRIDFPPFGMLHIEVLFRAVDQEDKPEKLFKGANLTWGWLNEVDTLHPNIRGFLMPRLGRYPGTRDGGCQWSGLWADMNAPDVDNYTYNWLVEQDMGLSEDAEATLRAIYGAQYGIGFHQQPGGLTAEAENLANLPAGYYERLAATMTSNDKRRFVDNEFGAVRSGQPVYPEFNDRFHATPALEPLRAIDGRAALLAIDGGTTPAAVLLQEGDDGQILVLDEIVVFANDDQTALEKMGPKGFAREVRRHLDRHWPKLKLQREIVGDPAILYGEHGDDLSWGQEFAREFKGVLRAAPVAGNRITPRLEAVRGCLTQNVGNKPGLLVSSRCRVLRQGFNAAYVYTRIRTSSGGGRWKSEPDKTDHSHVHDALQYGVLWVKKRGIASEDADRAEGAAKRQKQVARSGFAAGAAGSGR